MASLVPTTKNKEFQNWLRGALALLFTKQGLDGFVLDEITQFQRDLLAFIITKNNIPVGTICHACTTENVLPCPTSNFCPNGRRCNLHNPALPDKSPGQICPNNICHGIREAVRHEHRYNSPSWKNTDASKWCTNAYEIAKCYMAPDGYSAVSTFADTDFNGVLAVIINNKRFQNKMAAQFHQQINVCTKARSVGHVVRHSANLNITDTDLAEYINTLIDLLSDPKYLATDQNAQVAVNQLKQLKSNTLTVTTSDIILAMDNTLKDIFTKQTESIDAKKNEAEGEIEEKRNASLKLLCDFKESIANTKTLTLNHIAATKVSAVSEIENVSKIEKIAVSAIGIYERQLVSEEIKTLSEKEKQDIISTGAKERQLVSEEIKSVSKTQKKDLVSSAMKEKELVSEEIKSVSEKEKQDLVSCATKEKQLVSEEIKTVSKKQKQDLVSAGTKERQLVSEEIKIVSEKEKQDLVSAGTKERQLVSEEIKSVSEKKKQDLVSSLTIEKQLVSEEIKIVTEKEKQDLVSAGTKERQLVSKEIKSISEKEKQDLVSAGSKERQLVSEEIKSISEKEKQDLVSAGTKERQLLSEEIKNVSEKEKQDLVSTGSKERQLVSEEIKIVSEKEKQDLVSAGTKERQLVSEEIKNVSEKEKLVLVSAGTKERQLVSEEIRTVSEKEKHVLVSAGTKERQLVSEEIKIVSEKEKQELVSAGTKERQLVSEEIKSVTEKEKQKLLAVGAEERDLVSTEIKNVSEKEKEELTTIGVKERQLMGEQFRKANDYLQQQLTDVSTASMKQEQLKNCLRQNLINFYRTYHGAIPIAPLVEEHEVLLVEFYVQPPLTSVDITSRQLGESQVGLPVHSYRNLFFSGNGSLYKNIYITAKAGIGKTSFSKRICMAWCQAHNQLQSCVGKFQQEDIEVMKQFDFLFFLPLREADIFSCEADNMIYNQIISSLEDSHRYTEYFVRDVLRDMSCLIVLDGLDEWTHPESCKRRRNVHEIPHRPAWKRCSIVTTTRPWKLDVAHVSLTQVDMQVEINELNKTSSERLISNAVSLLNKIRPQKQAKSVEEFQKTTSFRNLEAIRYIPYILLQMICLWFDRTSIGKSKCEVYTNILELTFVRGLMKTGDTYWSTRRKLMSAIPSSIPACVLSHESCRSHFDVILSLGKVAFESLFTLNKESSLVFPKSLVLDSISVEMLTFLLKIGLLSQNKDYGLVARRQSNFSFQHKSVQEYFAALYIHSYHNNEHVRQRIRHVCNSLAAVLEMSNVLIFLGGFSSEACGKVMQLLHNIVSTDNAVAHIRNTCINVLSYQSHSSKAWGSFAAVKSFRDMQTDIVQEIMNTGQRHISLYTEDIIIKYAKDKTSYNLLKPLIDNSQIFIKSVFIMECQDFTEMLDTFGLRDVNSLLKLSICAVPTQPDLKRLLTGSVQTLMSCEILFFEYNNFRHIPKYTSMTSENIGMILNMKQLQSLSLVAAGLTHFDIKALFKHLSNRSAMTGISLSGIVCTTHKGKLCEHSLDLSQHQKLKHLELHFGMGVSVSKLRVNASSLEYCYIGPLPQHVYQTLVKTLPYATDLLGLAVGYSLEAFDLLKETLQHLPNVRTLIIRNIDLGDRTFTLPTQMRSLDNLILSKVTMTSAAIKILFDCADILPQPVRSSLYACTVNPEQEYQQLKDAFRSSHKCRIIFDGWDNTNQSVFIFQTVSCDTNQ